MHRKPIAIAFLLFLAAIAAEYVSWRAYSRNAIAAQLPRMLHDGLLNYERRMKPYNVWPREVHLVLAQSVPSALLSHVRDFERAYAPATVRLSTEKEATASGMLVKSRCSGCTVVHYEEESNNPLFARVAVSLSGGDHAVGYDHLFLNIFGRWVHLRTRFLWIT